MSQFYLKLIMGSLVRHAQLGGGSDLCDGRRVRSASIPGITPHAAPVLIGRRACPPKAGQRRRCRRRRFSFWRPFQTRDSSSGADRVFTLFLFSAKSEARDAGGSRRWALLAAHSSMASVVPGSEASQPPRASYPGGGQSR